VTELTSARVPGEQWWAAGTPWSHGEPADAAVDVIDVDVIDLTEVADVLLLEAAVTHVPARYERWVKPIIDRVVAGIALLLLSPVLFTAMLLIRWQLGNPVLFHQERLGHRGRSFDMLKFRTMNPDRRQQVRHFEGPDRRVTHKSKDDPRHTRLGRLLRSTSVDELPQLLNVLKGDMSLVGPRPELASVVHAHYQPWQHARHVVKPGLTGLWQITERGNGLMHEHITVDLEYVSRMSLWIDLRILLTTPLALIRQSRSAAW
jgi:lipopolysaccharide/colanic/teichoic acid biosynthesis glycosyltransferase